MNTTHLVPKVLLTSPSSALFAQFEEDEDFRVAVLAALNTTWLEYENFLLSGLFVDKIQGVYAEFGIWKGDRLKRHHEQAMLRGDNRLFLGFDSFQGLSAPTPDKDVSYFKKGMFAESYKSVSENLKIDLWDNVQLIVGWVESSLKMAPAISFDKIAFALIDTDIYLPCVEILEYLDGRLVHGGVLAFDDWTFDVKLGETRAFLEYLNTQTKWEFELLAVINYRVYFRVLSRGKKLKRSKKALNLSSIMNENNLMLWKKLRKNNQV
jgi:hypothetical protein